MIRIPRTIHHSLLTTHLKAARLAAAVVVAASCLPPPVQFFAAPQPGLTAFGTVTDTVLVVRFGATDSVSSDGLQLAFGLLDRAQAVDQRDVARTIEAVIASVPGPDRNRDSLSTSPEDEIARRLQTIQGSARRFDVLRADVVRINGLTADTVTVAQEPPDDFVDAKAPQRWLALILTADLWMNPSEGTRSDIRP